MTTTPITIAQLMRDVAFANAVEKFDAQFILQHTLNLSRASVIANPNKIIDANQAALMQSRLQRRAAGEPVAYILGQREFYGEMFKVSPAVLIPRPETEHLVEAALARLPEQSASRVLNLLDLGTGSGAIAITLKRLRPDVRVTATDISADALNIARENANNLEAEITFHQGSWYDALATTPQKFDIIVSNPPYIADGDAHLSQGDLRFEPAVALSDQTPNAGGFAALQHIINGAPNWLVDGGWLMFEHGYDQAKMAEDALFTGGFKQLFMEKDLSGCDRVSGGVWRGK
jgi:release factor glutamine methyltransferase